ncbi:MAG: cupin domain-containing protein [Pseudonocardia sp.]|uniref:Cupin n=2 Tax=Pseudonocardia sulfidoxydans TaxID=54011 RepID=A0A511DC56_9PSEU|nr:MULTISPECIES: cupin domain-containing protein [Pseudonocardia]ODU27358.1 MAG: cupin [Pseudonocardia sp. SCN 72-51]RTL69059.1 MAG: cupin domain-containing protein [Pseudonocardiaceae bacterium]MBN9112370.1 cupin domain-containing protein [Pseudonocardia sp.]ODV08971.1 MAG: cupin [Pseudonocardia sp. SCN 73-27]GEL22385.1 cupin [Pseudonocardia sulfidoxydans NBRC 16205]
MFGDEIVLGPLPKGITLANEGVQKRIWNILGHTYYMKAASDSSFAFETYDPPGTGVPPHVHPTQDEHIYVLEGVFTLYLDGQWETAGPGDTVRMPRNLPHAYYNRSEAPTRALFWVSPSGKLAQLFDKLHDLEDPAEVVRLSAECDVNFLPPGSVEGA